jgi:adenylosuccinate lyase
MKKILSELQVNESAISRELDRELEYLLSSKVLLKAVEKGMGRESAHKLILESATESRSSSSETFFELLAKNKELALSLSELGALKSNPSEHLGDGSKQVQEVLKLVRTQISALEKFGNQSLDEISN